MKKVYVFPGQGSQFPGMGKDLYNSNSLAKEMFELANEIIGFRISDIMFDGTDEELRQTKVTQPAIFIHSVVMAKCMKDFAPDIVAGHSLGEFSALTAAGSLTFEDGLNLVSSRAQAMQKACELQPGAMAAILGLNSDKIGEICRECSGIVVPANYNCEGQTVISGEVEAVEEACMKLKEAGARRALRLPVGGAFHSPLMEPARAELAEAIERTTISRPVCPIYQNITAEASVEPGIIKRNLLMQLTGPVLWSQIIFNIIENNVAEFYEIGPGNVLQGLISKIISKN